MYWEGVSFCTKRYAYGVRKVYFIVNSGYPRTLPLRDTRVHARIIHPLLLCYRNQDIPAIFGSTTRHRYQNKTETQCRSQQQKSEFCFRESIIFFCRHSLQKRKVNQIDIFKELHEDKDLTLLTALLTEGFLALSFFLFQIEFSCICFELIHRRKGPRRLFVPSPSCIHKGKDLNSTWTLGRSSHHFKEVSS